MRAMPLSGGIKDEQTKKAVRQLEVLLRGLGNFTANNPGLTPQSGGGTANFLRADGTWASVETSGGSVTSLTAGSSMVSLSASTGNVTIDVVPANFVGIPQSSVTGLVTALASKASTAVFTSGANGLAPASGGGTSNFLRADGTWAVPPGGGGIGASVTASFNSLPTTALNASTEGTIDWAFSDGITVNPPDTVAATNGVGWHRKALGGFIWSSFVWYLSSTTISATTLTNTSWGVTTTAGDEMTTPNSASTQAVMNQGTSSQTNFGFVFRVPASQTKRRVRVYGSNTQCTVTAFAVTSDGSASLGSSCTNSAGSTESKWTWDCTYWAAESCDLCIDFRVTAAASTTLNVKVSVITLTTP